MNSRVSLVAMIDPTTGQIVAGFSSKNEAASALGINKKYIRKACRLDTLCCGYRWDDERFPMHTGLDTSLQAKHVEQAKQYVMSRRTL